MAFNHVSLLDGPVLALLIARRARRETRFLVAAELMRAPLVGSVLRRYAQIPLRRGEADGAALDEAVRALREGALVGVAPEGRVAADPRSGLQRVRTGAARIALASGAPLVPVGIWGTQSRWPRSGLRLRRPWRPQVAMAIGGPILPASDRLDRHDIDSLTDRLRESMERQVERARTMADRA